MRAFLLCLLLAIHSIAFTTAPQVYFSPKDQLGDRLIRLIDEETESIETAIYCFTHREIGKALIAAKKRGVKVEVIVDPFSVKIKTPLSKLAKAGIPIYVWSPPETKTNTGKILRSPLMHDKFCVFGGKKVWTGSFNFTYEASRSNAENALLIDDVKVVQSFQEQFQMLKTKGCVPYRDYLTARALTKK